MKDDDDDDLRTTEVDDDPRNGDRWEAAQEGAELLRDHEIDAAVAELERVVKAQPDNEYALFFLGAAHFEAKRYDRAMKAYLAAVAVKPGYLGALAGVGHSLRMVGKHDESLRVAKQILLKSKDDADGLHLAGLAHFARGEAAAAAQYLERFLTTKPEAEVGQEVAGLLEVIRGQFEALDPDADLN
ncbi:MAG: tetratricopeptide repeat protein [Deltaproteobacteria bacterium]|nr:tetratricopeptide repeat protein [Deltaproteobacteria bacterium]